MKAFPLIKIKALLALLFVTISGFVLQFGAVGLVNGQTPNENFKVTTVYFVRHAERATDPTPDPQLSEAGKTRAQALARMLEKANVKAIFTTQFMRSKQTAEPLATRAGIPVNSLNVTISASNPREVSQQSLKEMTDKIYEHPGESVLMIGHTNTIPQVIKMLGGDIVPTIEEQKYDDLFIVTIYEKGKAKVAHLKY